MPLADQRPICHGMPNEIIDEHILPKGFVVG